MRAVIGLVLLMTIMPTQSFARGVYSYASENEVLLTSQNYTVNRNKLTQQLEESFKGNVDNVSLSWTYKEMVPAIQGLQWRSLSFNLESQGVVSKVSCYLGLYDRDVLALLIQSCKASTSITLQDQWIKLTRASEAQGG